MEHVNFIKCKHAVIYKQARKRASSSITLSGKQLKPSSLVQPTHEKYSHTRVYQRKAFAMRRLIEEGREFLERKKRSEKKTNNEKDGQKLRLFFFNN